MTSFEWWQSHVSEGSNGEQFMCMLCFEVLPISEAYIDTIGQAWDICAVCDKKDKAALELLEADRAMVYRTLDVDIPPALSRMPPEVADALQDGLQQGA